jgi:hypothetical protein
MRFYVSFRLAGIQKSADVAGADSIFCKYDNVNVVRTDRESILCFRSGETIELHGVDLETDVGVLLYGDFTAGGTPNDRPFWFAELKDRILRIEGWEDYGAAQRLKVAEKVVHGTAEARIRCVRSVFNASEIVTTVKIVASGGPAAFGDALELHAKILAGNYSARVRIKSQQ